MRYGQIFIASGSQGQEGGLGALGGNLADVHALGPGFVKAPAHGAAGPGAQGAAGLQLSPGVNMAQGQILQAGGRDLGPGHRAAGGAGIGRVAVQNHQLHRFVPGCPEPLQKAGAVHTLETGAPDPAVQLRQGDGLQSLPGEDVDVPRPGHLQIGRTGAQMVVVARGQEHRDCHGLQSSGQSPGLGAAALGPVQKVPRQQDQLAALGPAEPGQLLQLAQLLLPPGLGLLRGQAVEAGAQMEIGAAQNVNHTPSPAVCWCTGPPRPG